MKKTLLTSAFALLALAANAQQVTSPDGKMKLDFRIDGGRPTYTLTVDAEPSSRPPILATNSRAIAANKTPSRR